MLVPVRFANDAVVEVAPSSLGSPISVAAPASWDSDASRQVRARCTLAVSCRISVPVSVHGSSVARSSVIDDSCSINIETPNGWEHMFDFTFSPPVTQPLEHAFLLLFQQKSPGYMRPDPTLGQTSDSTRPTHRDSPQADRF